MDRITGVLFSLLVLAFGHLPASGKELKTSDILGVKVGMEMSDALAVLRNSLNEDLQIYYVDARDHFSKYLSRKFRKHCLPTEAGLLDAYVITRGYQIIALHFDRRDKRRKIHTITRTLDLKKARITQNNVLAALKQKYGRVIFKGGTYFNNNRSPTFSWGNCVRGRVLLYGRDSNRSRSGASLALSPAEIRRSRSTRDCSIPLTQSLGWKDPRGGLFFAADGPPSEQTPEVSVAKIVPYDATINRQTGLLRQGLIKLYYPTGGVSSPVQCGKTVYAKIFQDGQNIMAMTITTNVKTLYKNMKRNLRSLSLHSRQKQGRGDIKF